MPNTVDKYVAQVAWAACTHTDKTRSWPAFRKATDKGDRFKGEAHLHAEASQITVDVWLQDAFQIVCQSLDALLQPYELPMYQRLSIFLSH